MEKPVLPVVSQHTVEAVAESLREDRKILDIWLARLKRDNPHICHGALQFAVLERDGQILLGAVYAYQLFCAQAAADSITFT